MVGIWLYIPIGYFRKRQVLQAQGLFRYALSASLAFAQYARIPIVLVVPWGFRRKIKSLLLAAEPEAADRVSVVAPANISMYALAAIALSRLALFVSTVQWFSARIGLKTRTYRLPILLAILGLLGILVFDPSVTHAQVRTVLFLAASVLLAIIVIFFFILTSGVVFARLSRLGIDQFLYAKLEHGDALALTRFANRLDGIAYWWVPSTMFAASSELSRLTFVTFPDFAPLEDPTGAMLRSFPIERFKQICDATSQATRVICLSNYVKDVHLKSILPEAQAKALTVRPGPPRFFDAVSESHEPVEKNRLIELVSLLHQESTITVTVPTQNRPYKGLDSLIKSIAANRDTINFKLRVHLTCSGHDLGLGDLVKDLGLEDVVNFSPNLSDDELKNLIRRSTVCLSTSNFEASLPFTFSESTILGTPCLLNQMPVTMENLQEMTLGEKPLLTFDVHNFKDLEEKLIFISQNRAQVLEDQLKFHHYFYQRNSWERYIQTIESEWISLAPDFEGSTA